MKIRYELPGAIFTPDAFKIGQSFPFTVAGTAFPATLVRAVVIEDGRAAELTLDVPGHGPSEISPGHFVELRRYAA